MGQFAQQFTDFEQYGNEECYRSAVPVQLPSALANLLVTACGPDGDSATVTSMRAVADDLLTMAGRKPTANWDAESLKAEIRAAFHILEESRFDKFMDALLNALQRLYTAHLSTRIELLRDFNSVMLSSNMGYTVRALDNTGRIVWEARTEAADGITSLATTANAVADISQEAFDHLEQAKHHLLNPSKSRARKDAVRDAMSAMETMLKKLAADNDFDNACKRLRDEKVWGNDQVVKEGTAVWGLLHKHHPDVRHGQSSGTDVTLEEATYWIDRITAYIRYMASRKRVLGR